MFKFKSMSIKKHFTKLWLYFFSKRVKSCNHGFDIKEVVNLSIDPICKNCGKSLSELTILSNGAALTTINNKNKTTPALDTRHNDD